MAANPSDLKLLSELDDIMNLVRMLPFEVNLWKAQNVYYALLRTLYPTQVERNDEEARLTQMEGPLRQNEFNEYRAEARSLARTALFEILVFFGVLLVGFAYLWRRGDLAWVRSTAAEAEPERARPQAGKTTKAAEPEEVATV